MTELELYKFCEDREIQWGYDGELILWIPFYDLEEFTNLIGYGIIVDDGGLAVHLKEDCIALDLVEVCDYHDINPHNILECYR